MNCPECGEPLSDRPGPKVHTVAGRGDRWQGTLVELLDCNPAPPVSTSETALDSDTES